MSLSLKNKRAFVTGGSRGIGAAIVKRFASAGADVAFTYVNQSELANQVAKSAQESGVKSWAIKADNMIAEEINSAVELATENMGGIDIIVHNAGVALVGQIDNFKLDDFDRTMNVNLRAVFIATQAALKHMCSGGRIITIGSCNGDRVPFSGSSVYAMSKAGLIGFVKGLARDLGPRKITVNNIQPGPIDTDMNPANSDYAALVIKQVLAISHYGKADDVASMATFLAGPEAVFITGANFNVDGGYSA